MTRVTVITPSYNQAHYIGATIESVLAQDYPDLEYIIMDGGSTDHTFEVVQAYLQDKRLTWISEADKGMTDALNKGFARSTGEVMTWLNSDDTFIGQPLREGVAYFRANPQAEFLYRQVIFTHEDLTPLDLPPLGEPFSLIKMLSDDTVSILQPATMWRRSLWEKIGLLRADLQFAMDTEYWIRASRVTDLHFLTGVRATYRLQPEAKSARHVVKQWEERELLFAEALQKPHEFPEVQAQRRLIQSNLAWGLAQVYAKQGDKPTAKRYWRKALQFSPLRRRLILMALFGVELYSGLSLTQGVNRWWRNIKGVA